MSRFDASYYDYEDGDREDARREAAAARRRRNQTPEWYDAADPDEEAEDCGGGRGGCPGCDGCEVSTQVYRIRRARVAHRTTGGQTIAPGDYYGEVSVRIFQRGGPVIQRRRVLWPLTPRGQAACIEAGKSGHVVTGSQFHYLVWAAR